MRLIDADSIPWDVDGVGEIPVITKEEIDSMPTVDAIPVIRCRNCRHRMHDKTCIKVMKRKPDEGFCDEGERNEW